jgi:hypothetical protein
LFDKLTNGGGFDVFYMAPHSATSPSILIKSFLDFVVRKNPDIKQPFFAFPASKTFKYIDWGYEDNGKSLKSVIYEYLDNDSEETKTRLLNLLKFDSERTITDNEKDGFVETVNKLKAILQTQIEKNNADIKIALFDEGRSSGHTSEQMDLLVKSVVSYFEDKNKIKIKIEFLPTVYGRNYVPGASPFIRDDIRWGEATGFTRVTGLDRTKFLRESSILKLAGEFSGIEEYYNEKIDTVPRRGLPLVTNF